MLLRMDGLVVATPDAAEAVKGWELVFGVVHDRDDPLPALGARRARYRVGDGAIDFVEPDGSGPVADAVARRGGHLFAGRFATEDVGAFAARVASFGATPVDIGGGEGFLDEESTGGHGLRVVFGPVVERERAGRLDHFYELTNLVEDAPAVTRLYAERFGLESSVFAPIGSPQYGYEGTLTLFDPDRLDRFEVITPNDATKTMGRYFSKFGESLYMAFCESGALPDIERRAAELGFPVTAEPRPDRRDSLGPHTIFVHPPALGGVMVGVSRRTYAWTWSGKPDRVAVAP